MNFKDSKDITHNEFEMLYDSKDDYFCKNIGGVGYFLIPNVTPYI